MSLADTARMLAELGLDDRKFQSGAKRALGTLGKLEKGTGRVGKGAGQLSAGLARSGAIIGAAVVTGLTGAAKAAIDFEDAFQGVVKTVDPKQLAEAGLTFDDLRESFRKMATEIPVGVNELSAIGAEAGALGVKAGDIEAFTKVVAELGVTTNLSTDQAAEALGKVGTILHLTGKDFEDFSDVLVNLGNNGASTEADIIGITERFAAAGKQAGLTTPQILALSSAASSVGIDVEAAGGSLSRLFNSMATNIALANVKGQGFAKVTGKSLKELQRDLNKGKGFAVFQEFLKGLQGLSRTEFAKALKGAGITNVRDVNAIQLMAQNMGFFNEQVETATHSTGALGKEASQRFDTIKSKLLLLKNGLIDAGITLGEGFTPAVGRAAQKLSEFLKVDANRSALKTLGEDIGKAIDGIDWKEVLDGARDFIGYMKIALGYAKNLFDAVNALPTEIKAAGLGFIGLNKLSGGLLGAGVGNIFGGLAESIGRSVAASIPVIGKAFVQPVFVTNMPAGGLGGAGGAAGGAGGLLGAGATIGSLVLPAVIVTAITGAITAAAQNLATGVGLKSEIANPIEGPFGIVGTLKNLVGITTELLGVAQNPPPPPPIPLAGSERQEAQNELPKLRDAVESTKIAQVAGTAKAIAATNVVRDKVEAGTIRNASKSDELRAAQERTKAAADAVRDRVESTKIAVTGAVSTSGSNIVGAIHGIPAPVVNLYNNIDISATTVQRKTTVVRRYGPTGGSKNTVARKKE